METITETEFLQSLSCDNPVDPNINSGTLFIKNNCVGIEDPSLKLGYNILFLNAIIQILAVFQ